MGRVWSNLINRLKLRSFMATRKMQRFTTFNLNKGISSAGTKVFELGMLLEQMANTRVDKVKLSIIPSASNTGESFLVHASSANNTGNQQDYITAQAVPSGGGTVWLSLKRTIKTDDYEEDGNFGKLSIWVRSSTACNADIVCEAWGHYINNRAQ